MKQLFLATILICGSIFAFGQQALTALQVDKSNFNLDFERGAIAYKSPADWQIGTTVSGFKVSVDSNQKHSGKYALLIENLKKDVDESSGMSNLIIPLKYEGKEVEVKFYLKMQNVKGHVNFPLRIDDEDNDKLQFTNLLAKRIHGTADWKQYSLKLPLQKEAATIYLYPLLYGPGKMWIDDVQVLFDGVDISKAKVKADYNPVAYKPIDYGNHAAASGKVKVRDAELYYENYGDGTPLLLLHGNSQSIHVFKKQIKAFSKSYKVIAVDTRGQGKSTDTTAEPLSYDLYAEDMKTLLDSLHIAKANILGWSDGGNTGLIMASKYPDYVNKLAITGACTNPNLAVSDKTLKEVEQGIKKLKSKTDEKSAYQEKLFAMLLTEPHILTEDLNKIKSPVLVMAGAQDMILEKHTRYIADQISKSSLFIFKDATHYVPVEKAAEFNTKVLSFFE
ncbi:alpha/beta hydrolase [Pedobacter aquatilis]|uniref:alpha/beta fold hydrolase n=1 Tax=Pedobacter aquatilis TaxID=351343 RepID=UPI002930DB36|nr:alpha/beta hydrolase [Pedobacter aquatilis]